MNSQLEARLPAGISSRRVSNGNGLDMFVLTAGDDAPDRPLALLLHGFPELAFSWRRVMLPLAEAGFFVVAPDQRGYGLTTGSDDRYDGPLASFGLLNLVRDQIGLLAALGRAKVDLLVGHDFGSPVASWCALIRPDTFGAIALMSAPFGGPPPFPSATPALGSGVAGIDHHAMTALMRPRKHYQWYYSEAHADRDMLDAPQGLHQFLRNYYHAKSADWTGNDPQPLPDWSAESLATLPTYYVMDHADSMPQAVHTMQPTPQEVAHCNWLPDEDLAVYAAAFARRGFQGGLQWYRCATHPDTAQELRLFAGRTIDQPACFIAGRQDWGVFQKPGEYERMSGTACRDFRGATLIEGAGHWVQQEQPDAVVQALLKFAASAHMA